MIKLIFGDKKKEYPSFRDFKKDDDTLHEIGGKALEKSVWAWVFLILILVISLTYFYFNVLNL